MHNSSAGSSLRWQTAKHALRCLIGCNIGEGVGAAIGFMLGWDMILTLVLAVGLAFAIGYAKYSISNLDLTESFLPFSVKVD
jgi:hypothetical protein